MNRSRPPTVDSAAVHGGVVSVRYIYIYIYYIYMYIYIYIYIIYIYIYIYIYIQDEQTFSTWELIQTFQVS